MTIDNMTKTEEDCKRQVYLRLHNLPWSACHQDVRDFLKCVEIPQGGISIHNTDAFVLLQSEDDIATALRCDGRTLQDNVIKLSSVDLNDLKQIITDNTRRSLSFLNSQISPDLETIERLVYKKIRPTSVGSGEVLPSVFIPDEVEFPELNSGKIVKRAVFVKKRINPTKLTSSNHLSGVFTPDEVKVVGRCSKRLKFSDSQ